jgi:predicted glycosyltransferase
MRILFDFGHPADVHYFKHLIRYLNKSGHICLIFARDKDVTKPLLDHLDLPFINKGSGGTGFFDRAEYMIHSLVLLQSTISREKPDLCISHGSPYLAIAARLNRLPHIMFNDTEKAAFFKQVVQLCNPDAYVPDCFSDREIKGLHRLPSYMELGYLHPDLFEPDPEVRSTLGERYTLLRFVSHSALHDVGSIETDIRFKQKIIETLEPFGPVWLSSETELPGELETYRIPLPADQIHNAIAGAGLVMGESATMCAEAAVLGVPSIHIHKNRWGYVKELESRYGLIRHFPDRGAGPESALKTAVKILSDEQYRPENQLRRKHLLSEKKNMTDLMIEIVDRKLNEITVF